MALKNIAGKGLIDSNYKGRDYIDPPSTLNQRRDFHLNYHSKAREAAALASNSSGMKPKKRSLTFNQLLAKYGYIEDESVTSKNRVRPWHVKQNRANYDSSDSSDD